MWTVSRNKSWDATVDCNGAWSNVLLHYQATLSITNVVPWFYLIQSPLGLCCVKKILIALCNIKMSVPWKREPEFFSDTIAQSFLITFNIVNLRDLSLISASSTVGPHQARTPQTFGPKFPPGFVQVLVTTKKLKRQRVFRSWSDLTVDQFLSWNPSFLRKWKF